MTYNFPRLKHYNYSRCGIYFVTICIKNRAKMFGEIVEDSMSLSVVGELAKAVWDDIPNKFPGVELDLYVFMPNHFHGLLIFTEAIPQDISKHKHLLGEVVRVFKAHTSYFLHAAGVDEFHWQQKYWDSVIRNERHLEVIRQYIINNPAKWALDTLYL